MKTHIDIQKQVDKALDSMENVLEVKVSPFFKDKTMQHLFAEKEEKQVVWLWFTPKLQFAALVVVVVLNVLALSQLDSSVEVETVSDFVEAYDLSSDEELLVFN